MKLTGKTQRTQAETRCIQALAQIEDRLGGTCERPLSFALQCLVLWVSVEEERRVVEAFTQCVASGEEISEETLFRVIHMNVDGCEDTSCEVLRGFLYACARWRMKQLRPMLEKIYGHDIDWEAVPHRSAVDACCAQEPYTIGVCRGAEIRENLFTQTLQDGEKMSETIRPEYQDQIFRALCEIEETFCPLSQWPLSLALTCMKYGISADEEGKLMVEFVRLLGEKDSSELCLADVRAIVQQHCSSKKEWSDEEVIEVVKAYAKWVVNDLRPFAQSL